MEKTDEELVAECLGGNEDAFTPLVQRHLKSVYSFAARSVGNEAEDVVQDTFVKAWKNLRKYNQHEAQFKTWLMRIARNTIIDALRKKKSHVFSDFEDDRDDIPFANIPDSEPLPDEIAARAHDAQEIEAALQKLAPMYREVILLHNMSQLTFQEMSAVLLEPQNTIRSRHRRALAKLRHHLELHQK